MRKRPLTTGELISNLCFIGVGLWSLGTGIEASFPKSVVLILCALACFAGAARYPLARLLSRD